MPGKLPVNSEAKCGMSECEKISFENFPEALVVRVQSEKLDYMVLDKLERRITAQATMAGKFNVILDLHTRCPVPLDKFLTAFFSHFVSPAESDKNQN